MKQQYTHFNMLKLDIHMGAYVELSHRWKRENVCSPFTRLYYIHTGAGYLRCHGQLITLEPGYAYLIPSGCQFDYGCTQMNKLFFHITLTGAEGTDLLSNFREICRIPWSEEQLQQLMQCNGAQDYGSLIRLKAMIHRTIENCMAVSPLPPMPVQQYSPLVQDALLYIRQNLTHGLRCADIADALFTSESRLRKYFRQELGMPIGNYIDEQVLLRAKQLLLDETVPIGWISQSLGFCDQFYFSRRFREKFHQTPSAFRKEAVPFPQDS